MKKYKGKKMNLRKLIEFPKKKDLCVGMKFRLKPENDYSDWGIGKQEDIIYEISIDNPEYIILNVNWSMDYEFLKEYFNYEGE